MSRPFSWIVGQVLLGLAVGALAFPGLLWALNAMLNDSVFRYQGF